MSLFSEKTIITNYVTFLRENNYVSFLPRKVFLPRQHSTDPVNVLNVLKTNLKTDGINPCKR